MEINFHELPASKEASGLIECFWYFSESQSITLIPDGVYNILIGEVEFVNNQNGFQNSHDILFLPLLKNSVIIRAKNPILVIRRKAFVHSSQKNSLVFIKSLKDSFRKQEYSLNANCLEKLTQDISRKFSENYYRVPVLTHIINEILSRKGQLTLSEVYVDWNLSRQSVSKTYARWIDISLKELSTIWRLNDFLVKMSSSHIMTSAFVDAGFFDQTHGTKYFKKYYNATPNAFLAEYEDKITSIVSPIQKRFSGLYDPING